MPRVFVVSPLPAVRAGLRSLLADSDLEVVGEAERLDQSSDDLRGTGTDVVLVDLEPNLDLGALAALDGIEAGPGVVVLGPPSGDGQLAADLAGRAWAYIARDSSGEQIVAAVRAVANGLVVIDQALGSRLLVPDSAGADGSLVGGGEELTAREREVLQLVALGLANKTIAARLGISEHTVKFHVAAILAKLGAGSRTEAAHLGARRGLVVL